MRSGGIASARAFFINLHREQISPTKGRSKVKNAKTSGLGLFASAKKKELRIRTEREMREEQYRMEQALTRKRQRLFEQYYGDLVDERQRIDFYVMVERKYSRYVDLFQAYPPCVREKIAALRRLVRELREDGVDDRCLRELLLSEHPLSRLLVTADYRLFLLDFGNMEIVMSPLPKAVFLLFLQHPEGIVFKELPDYLTELTRIYREITAGRTYGERVERSLAALCDPLSNSINEKCARIREAFLGKLAEGVTLNYCIQGERGMPKRISLPRSLVRWE